MANELDPHTIKTFNIATSPSGSTYIPVRIVEPKITSENLPLSTWASSLILANALHQFDLGRHLDPSSFPATPVPSALSGKPSSDHHTSPALRIHPIIEIGAGTGLVGLTAAALLGATHATLTDLSGIVPGIAANIAVNAELLVSRKCVVRAGTLDWEHPEILDYPLTGKGSSLPPQLVAAAVPDEPDQPPNTTQTRPEPEPEPEQKETDEVGHVASSAPNTDADEAARSGESTPRTPAPVFRARLILASDVIYDEDHPGMLASVVRTWLDRTPAARFVICYALRVAYLDYVRDLWTRLEALGLVAEMEGQERGEEETNGDDEMLCEYVVWKWSGKTLRGLGFDVVDTEEEAKGEGAEGAEGAEMVAMQEGLEKLGIREG